jgi:hypothetical protein
MDPWSFSSSVDGTCPTCGEAVELVARTEAQDPASDVDPARTPTLRPPEGTCDGCHAKLIALDGRILTTSPVRN